MQIELDYGTYTAGIELIIYWDVEECEEDGYVIACYSYDGRSVNLNDPLWGSVLASVVDNAGLLASGTEAGMNTMLDILKNGFSASASGVLLLGNDEFTSVTSYEGPFTSVYGSINHVKGGAAYSSNCIAVALGATTSKTPCWGFSRTDYTMLNYFSLAS